MRMSSTWTRQPTQTLAPMRLLRNAVAGTSAHITASATDADGTTNTVTYAITAQSCSGAFAIDASSGAVTVSDSSVLDHETSTSCTVAVTATSADGSTAETTFTVTITDADDTAPVFTSDSTAVIQENTQDVVALTVSDTDSTACLLYTSPSPRDRG